ncbi:MAG: DUF2807 domain-containing protein [Bacteroidota bacterium]
MRNLMILVLLCFVQFSIAQINGNEKLITQTFPIDDIEVVEIHLYADIVIDCGVTTSSLEITAEENLMPYISREMEDGKLTFGQKKWIEPEIDIQIKIGAPNLEQVIQSTHEKVQVKNIDRIEFSAMALVGEIALVGKVQRLNASGEVGTVDARKLDVTAANVNLWNWGTIELASPKRIEGIVKNSGTVYYEGSEVQVKVRTSSEGVVQDRNESKPAKYDTRFVDLKIKNNSMQRINAYVKGPKPDGKHFSYGFPLNPGQTRHKNWTIGTKVYQVSRLGTRKLLVEIEEEDEGKVVKLYE